MSKGIDLRLYLRVSQKRHARLHEFLANCGAAPDAAIELMQIGLKYRNIDANPEMLFRLVGGSVAVPQQTASGILADDKARPVPADLVGHPNGDESPAPVVDYAGFEEMFASFTRN